MRTIDGMYTIYKCIRCKKDNILITEEVSGTLRSGKYISCSHCGCKNLKEGKSTDDLRECMDHATYKKVCGAIRQVHSV